MGRERRLKMVYKIPDRALDFPMRVVCAWCGVFLYWGRCIKPDETSHGICDVCMAVECENYDRVPDIPGPTAE